MDWTHRADDLIQPLLLSPYSTQWEPLVGLPLKLAPILYGHCELSHWEYYVSELALLMTYSLLNNFQK